MLTIQLVGSKFPPEYAGAGVRIHNTYKRLITNGETLQWRVVTGSVEFPGIATYVHNGITVERISSRLFTRWRALPSLSTKLIYVLRSWSEALLLWRRLHAKKFDLLHVFGSSSVTAAAIAWAAWKQRPVVIELITTKASALQTLPGLRIGTFLRKRLQHRCLIIAISAALGERSLQDGFTRNVWTRPNPVDTKRFFPAANERHSLRTLHTPFTADDVVLAMVAKFMPQKNQIFLPDVLAKLPERYKLVLAGPIVNKGPLVERDHSYLTALRQRISELKLASRVFIVTEFVPADEFIKLADIYMLPNRDEGLATPMLESLACGVPVVANSAEAAFQQWVENGRSGFLCPLDAGIWADAVKRATELPRSELIEAARKISAMASADTIDRQFLHLAKALAALPTDGKFDVASVLRGAS